MNEVELLERAILRKEFELQELFKDIAHIQKMLRSAKLLHKIYNEDQRLDDLVHFCINGKYPNE